MKKCYSCGADVPDNAKLCSKCGKEVEISQELIDRAKADDSDAQTELYERTYKTVYSRIRAKVPDEDTAMDIMQESYLRAFSSLDQLQKVGTFPSWLLTIASRQVCDWYKKNEKEQQNVQMSQLEYEDDDTISDEENLLEEPEYRENFSPDESLDRAETGRLLSKILDTLPEDQRIILTMRYYDEMSLQEISDELGVNLSTVKSRLTAGKKKVEAKVLELEKSGTKLYSLSPVAFLVYLFHHAERFTPAISANTVIGLTGAGAAATAGWTAVSAASQTAAGVTGKAAAAATVKAAGGAVAKGLGVKIAAVAAAVVVAGGVTTAVVVSNNIEQEEASATRGKTVAEVMALKPSPAKPSPAEESEQISESAAADDVPEKAIKSDTFRDSAGAVCAFHEYDPDGNMLSEYYNAPGVNFLWREYTYDTEGNMLTRTEKSTDGTVSEWREYTCDTDGNMLTETIYNSEGNIDSINEYTYDGDGNMLSTTTYNNNGDVTHRSEYTYDDNGNELTFKDYSGGNEQPTNNWEYIYDSDGNKLTFIVYNNSEDPFSVKHNYTYDDSGNMVTETCYMGSSPNTIFLKDVLTYDSNGNMLTMTEYGSEGTIVSMYVKTYDSNGNLLTEGEGNFVKKSYTYDDDGNLLTETSYGSDGSVEQYTHTYEYYD